MSKAPAGGRRTQSLRDKGTCGRPMAASAASTGSLGKQGFLNSRHLRSQPREKMDPAEQKELDPRTGPESLGQGGGGDRAGWRQTLSWVKGLGTELSWRQALSLG